MPHNNIFIFLHSNKVSLYTYEQNTFTPRCYKGNSTIYLNPDDVNFWESFWEYSKMEHLNEPWERLSLRVLYHSTPIKICQELIAYPCREGLEQVNMESLTLALPQLLCKMDILKQGLCPVRFEDAAWHVSPYHASPVPLEAIVSPYKLREDEIVKAYLGAFPVQGSGNIQPTNNVPSKSKGLDKFIETSKVKAKHYPSGGHHE